MTYLHMLHQCPLGVSTLLSFKTNFTLTMSVKMSQTSPASSFLFCNKMGIETLPQTPNSYMATPPRLQSIHIASSSHVPAPPSNQLVSNLPQPPSISQSTSFSHAHSYYQQRTPLVHNPYAHLLYYSLPPSHQGYAPLPPQYTPTRPQSAFVEGLSSLEFRNYIPANPSPSQIPSSTSTPQIPNPST